MKNWCECDKTYKAITELRNHVIIYPFKEHKCGECYGIFQTKCDIEITYQAIIVMIKFAHAVSVEKNV